MPPHNPDEWLPSVQFSLSTLIENGENVLSNQDDDNRVFNFVRYMTGGRFDDISGLHRVYVNPRQGLDSPLPQSLDNPAGYIIRRDYDSVIGITRTLPFRRGIAVYPLPPFKEVMKTDMHITHEIKLPDVRECLHIF